MCRSVFYRQRCDHCGGVGQEFRETQHCLYRGTADCVPNRSCLPGEVVETCEPCRTIDFTAMIPDEMLQRRPPRPRRPRPTQISRERRNIDREAAARTELLRERARQWQEERGFASRSTASEQQARLAGSARIRAQTLQRIRNRN